MPHSKTYGSYLFTEVFPIQKDLLPQLFAYRLQVSGSILKELGWKVAYQLIEEWKGHWVFTDNMLVGDLKKSEDECNQILYSLWDKKEDLKNVYDITPVHSDEFSLTSGQLALFVAHRLTREFRGDIKNALRKFTAEFGDIVVEKNFEIREWVIQDHPCISINIFSELSHKLDAESFVTQYKPITLINKWVKTKYDNTAGEVIDVVGPVKEHRQRLLAFKPKPDSKKYIENSHDDSIVVKVQIGKKCSYDYVVSALNLSIKIPELSQYHTDSLSVLSEMRLPPKKRWELISKVADIVADKGWIRKEPVSHKKGKKVFFSQEDVLSVPKIKIGSEMVHPFDEKRILPLLKEYGLYKLSRPGTNTRVGIISTLEIKKATSFLEKLKKELGSLQIKLEHIGNAQKLASTQRIDIEKAVNELSVRQPDIILAILPEISIDSEKEDRENDLYHHLKEITVRNGIQSQVINQITITGTDKQGNPRYQWAMGNIVLGILAKTGNIPYILEKPLEFADFVIGIDVGRKGKQKTSGSINAAAVARIYLSNGEFLKYNIYDANLEGEALPVTVLQSLFPLKDFQGKRVVIHRDGGFKGAEVQTLESWARDLNAVFYLVEITKTGNPRIYSGTYKEVKSPDKADGFYIDDQQAILVSSLPAFKNGTPQPLRIKCMSNNITIIQAIQSVLTMTLLHYGSLHPPRLPVTIHYSDIIANLALDGIKPKNMEGNIPYWL